MSSLNDYLAVVRAARLSGEVLIPSKIGANQDRLQNKIRKKRILTFRQYIASQGM
jgi:hypothetical protein